MIKKLIKSALPAGSVWRLACRTMRLRGVTVLMYHRIIAPDCTGFAGTDVGFFREQMQWLRRHCQPIAPEDLGTAAQTAARHKPPVLVTFDDGYSDFHDHAYPVLAGLEIPALVFLATHAIDTGQMIWTDAVIDAINRSSQMQIQLPFLPQTSYPLVSGQDRQAFGVACKNVLKGVSNAERERCLGILYQALLANESVPQRHMLNWAEVRRTMPLTRYGGHTHNHPILSQLDAGAMEQEIVLCKDRITKETGQAPRFFAYPNGRAQDFNDLTKTLLKKHGFDTSFSTIEGIHQAGDDAYAIRRQHTGAKSLGDFALRVLGR